MHEESAYLEAKRLDAALENNEPAAKICNILHFLKEEPREVFRQMTMLGRIFSAEFKYRCDDDDRELIDALSDDAPKIYGENLYRQIAGLEELEYRRKAMTMCGRHTIRLGNTFRDNARYEIHDIFVRVADIATYAKKLSEVPNLDSNDIARTIWAGRIYQKDFFLAAPQRLKIKMIEFLSCVDPAIAQPFVAQILKDRAIPMCYRVLVWTEAVLAPHQIGVERNHEIERAYEASPEMRRRHLKAKMGNRSSWDELNSSAEEWFSTYEGGDEPAIFDMQRTIRGYKLERWMICRLIARSQLNILTYYLTENRAELEACISLLDFVVEVCVTSSCKCVTQLLDVVEKLSPRIMSKYRGGNLSDALEIILYRYHNMLPENGGWLRTCFRNNWAEIVMLSDALKRLGCNEKHKNSQGISWKDIKAAAKIKFDGTSFEEK